MLTAEIEIRIPLNDLKQEVRNIIANKVYDRQTIFGLVWFLTAVRVLDDGGVVLTYKAIGEA